MLNELFLCWHICGSKHFSYLGKALFTLILSFYWLYLRACAFPPSSSSARSTISALTVLLMSLRLLVSCCLGCPSSLRCHHHGHQAVSVSAASGVPLVSWLALCGLSLAWTLLPCAPPVLLLPCCLRMLAAPRPGCWVHGCCCHCQGLKVLGMCVQPPLPVDLVSGMLPLGAGSLTSSVVPEAPSYRFHLPPLGGSKG